jgi:3-hydroxyacyl-[acyl-carrier-protein] dehydratase
MSHQLSSRPTCATPLEAFDRAWSERDGGCTMVRATLEVGLDSPYLTAHFPDFTIYPGVFLLETAIQAVAAELGLGAAAAAGVTHVRSMRFVAPFVLGDTIEMEAVVSARDDGLEVDARFAHAVDAHFAHAVDGRGDAARIRLALYPRADDRRADHASVSDA